MSVPAQVYIIYRDRWIDIDIDIDIEIDIDIGIGIGIGIYIYTHVSIFNGKTILCLGALLCQVPPCKCWLVEHPHSNKKKYVHTIPYCK